MKKYVPIGIAAIAVAASLAFSGTAEAVIRCNGQFQVNSQGEFSSPYCEANLLAQVARAHGVHVSAAAIRNSISVQQDTCLRVGPDPQVSEICQRLNQGTTNCTLFNCN